MDRLEIILWSFGQGGYKPEVEISMFDQAWHPCDLCNLERWSEGGPGLASSYSRQSRQPSPSMYHDDDNGNDDDN